MKAGGRKGVGKIWTKDEFMTAFHLTENDWMGWVAEGLPRDQLQDGTIVINETEVDEWNQRRRGGASDGLVLLERPAAAAEQIATYLTPTPPEKVGTPYVAQRLGKTVKWIGDLVRNGAIPKSCIVPGTGNGKEWRFFREKIDKWIEEG
jgi:hypothetical protein